MSKNTIFINKMYHYNLYTLYKCNKRNAFIEKLVLSIINTASIISPLLINMNNNESNVDNNNENNNENNNIVNRKSNNKIDDGKLYEFIDKYNSYRNHIIDECEYIQDLYNKISNDKNSISDMNCLFNDKNKICIYNNKLVYNDEYIKTNQLINITNDHKLDINNFITNIYNTFNLIEKNIIQVDHEVHDVQPGIYNVSTVINNSHNRFEFNKEIIRKYFIDEDKFRKSEKTQLIIGLVGGYDSDIRHGKYY